MCGYRTPHLELPLIIVPFFFWYWILSRKDVDLRWFGDLHLTLEWLLRSWWWWTRSGEEYEVLLGIEFHLHPLQQQSSLHQEWTRSVPPYIAALQLSSLQNQTFAAAPPFDLYSPVVPVETAVFLFPTTTTIAEHDLAHAPRSPHSVLKTVSR